MNQQALLRKARELQQEMLNTQKEIEEAEFTNVSGPVSITMKGTKQIVKVVIDKDYEITSSDDIELLEDSIVAASNNLIDEINKYTEEKMAKYKSFLGGFGGF